MKEFKPGDKVKHYQLGVGTFKQYSDKSKKHAVVIFSKEGKNPYSLNLNIDNLVKLEKPLSESEIQDGQRRWKEYNTNLDKIIELGKQFIKSYGREI
jgi:hypothetical protein